MGDRIVYTTSRRTKKSGSLRRLLPYAAIAASGVLIAAGAVALLRMPSLQIRAISFSGVRTLDEGAIRRHIAESLAGSRFVALPRSSFFLADSREIARGLEAAFPRLRSVSAVKKFPAALEVSLEEREFWGISCAIPDASSTPSCAFIDPAGIAYAPAPEPHGVLIRVIRDEQGEAPAIGGAAVDSYTMDRIRAFGQAIAEKTNIDIAEFALNPHVPGEIRARAPQGFDLILKRASDPTAAASVLQRVLEEEIKDQRSRLDYIDLRFGNKVFYKLR